MINVHHTDNGIFNTSMFMEDMLNKQQKIRFSGYIASHKNGSAERTINMVVTIESAIFIQAGMICHKDTLSIDFGQHKLTMLYGSKFGSVIYSMVYKPLCKFEPSIFWSQGFSFQASETLAPKHRWIKLAYRIVYHTVYQGSNFRSIQHIPFPSDKISG